jgi:hypothetical protein
MISVILILALLVNLVALDQERIGCQGVLDSWNKPQLGWVEIHRSRY